MATYLYITYGAFLRRVPGAQHMSHRASAVGARERGTVLYMARIADI
jgi:hypothetical protein